MHAVLYAYIKYTDAYNSNTVLQSNHEIHFSLNDISTYFNTVKPKDTTKNMNSCVCNRCLWGKDSMCKHSLCIFVDLNKLQFNQ